MNKQALRTLLLGGLAVVITWVLAVIFIGVEYVGKLRSLAVVGSVMLSELLLTFSFYRLHGTTRAKSFPVMLGFVVIPWGYFFFTLLMLITYSSDLSDNGILAIQAIVLFLVLTFESTFQMAKETVQAHSEEMEKANSFRFSFRTIVDGVLKTLRGRFCADKELNKLFDQLYDSARYAADSVPGSEKIDEELENNLIALESRAITMPAEEVSEAILSVLSQFRKRENVMKRLR